MIRSRVGLGVVAMMVVMSPLTGAHARGTNVTLKLSPQGREADVVRDGFQLYSMIKGWKRQPNRANVDQRGSGNGVAIGQHGDSNVANVVQRGNDHSATITQNGQGNWLSLFQFGRRARSDIAQTGNGKTEVVVQGNW